MVNKEKVPEIRFPEFTDDWQEKVFGEILVSARLGGNYGNSETENAMPLIKMGNIGRGSIKLDKIEYIDSDEELNDLDKIQENDLFFNTRNTLELVGKVAIWRNELPVAYYNSNLMCIRFENNRFMNYRLNTTECVKSLNRVATGTTSVAAIYNRDLVKIKFHIPTLPEQTKIANFLTAVDAKIANLSEEKSLLENYKKGVMQKLFNGKWKTVNGKLQFIPPSLRFKQDDGSDFPEWETKRGSTIFRSHSNKDHDGSLPILSASQQFGMVYREDNGIRIQATAESVKSYKVVESGDFVISLRSFQGGIEYSKLHGICSPAYIILKPKIRIDSIFFKFYFKKDSFIERLSKTVVGIRDGKQITYDAFGGLKLVLPSIEEQTKIGNFLTSIDEKITTATEAIEKAQEWKKGLLQQLFI